PLADADGQTVGDDSLTLDVNGSDSTSGFTSSGVTSIKIQVDGVTKATYTQSCPNLGCGMDESWAFNTADYSNDDHTIDAIVTDQAGNTNDAQVQVTVQNSTPLTSDTLDLGASPSPSGSRLDITGAAPGDHAGQAVADIGDVNGDGLDDY